MKTIYLHVGLHKTATTALQHFLYSNQQALLDAGIYYPKTGLVGKGMHHNIPGSLFHASHLKHSPKLDFNALLKTLTAEIKPHERILISSEVFSEPIERNRCRLFRDIADEVKIIIYLRRQDLYIESVYGFLVKIGKFSNSFSNFKYEKVFNLDYRIKIEEWAALFGRENIIVRIYESGQFHGGTIFHDFMHTLGVPLGPEFRLPPKRINVSLTRDLLELRILLNQLGTDNAIVSSLEALSIQLKKEDPTLPYGILSPEERKALLTKHADSNAWIANTFLGREDGILFYAPIQPEAWRPYPGLQDEQILQALTFIHQNNPPVFDEICKLVFQGIKGEEGMQQRAAFTIGSSLSYLLLDEKFAANGYKPALKKILATYFAKFKSLF
jgi:hypothetical protein